MLSLIHLVLFQANIFSLPMSPKRMSRYVDKKALTLVFIAFSSLESLAAQTISIHSADYSFLPSSIRGRQAPSSPHIFSALCETSCWALSKYGERDLLLVLTHLELRLLCSLSTLPRMINDHSDFSSVTRFHFSSST